MLTADEEKFLNYWEKNRSKDRSLKRYLSLGVPLGLLIGLGILLNYVSGWYTRATMVANSQSTPLVLIIAIIIITIFCSVFYRQHQWEMNEQRFLELTQKKDSQKSFDDKQQDSQKNGQLDK